MLWCCPPSWSATKCSATPSLFKQPTSSGALRACSANWASAQRRLALIRSPAYSVSVISRCSQRSSLSCPPDQRLPIPRRQSRLGGFLEGHDLIPPCPHLGEDRLL